MNNCYHNCEDCASPLPKTRFEMRSISDRLAYYLGYFRQLISISDELFNSLTQRPFVLEVARHRAKPPLQKLARSSLANSALSDLVSNKYENLGFEMGSGIINSPTPIIKSTFWSEY
jgi:hypothetical protein